MEKLGEFAGIKLYSLDKNEVIIDKYAFGVFAMTIESILPVCKPIAAQTVGSQTDTAPNSVLLEIALSVRILLARQKQSPEDQSLSSHLSAMDEVIAQLQQ